MSMRSFFCLFPTTHPSLSLLKIQQDMTQSELSQLIAALRAETQQNAVSPDSLGAILEKMVERIEQASAISPLDRVITLSSTGLLPDLPSAEEMRTLYLIDGNIWGFVRCARNTASTNSMTIRTSSKSGRKTCRNGCSPTWARP